MAGWNGSGQRGNSAPIQPKVKAKKPSPVSGIVAGLVVVAAACAAYFAFFSGSEKPKVEKVERERGRIKEVTPAPAPTNRVAKAQEPEKKQYTNDPPGTVRREDGEIVKGWVTLPNGKKHYRRGLISEKPTLDRRGKYSIFENPVDNELAELTMLEGGAMLIGGPMNYRGKYKEAFLESLKTPIIIKDDDTEEHKMIKQMVIESRKELKAALDRGEDIEKIVADTYKEAEKLSAYKDQVRQMVFDTKKENPDLTDQDLCDLLDAANKMLEEKGIAPMKLGVVTRARLRIRRK